MQPAVSLESELSLINPSQIPTGYHILSGSDQNNILAALVMRYLRNARIYQPQPLEMFLKEEDIELIRARGIIDEEVRGL